MGYDITLPFIRKNPWVKDILKTYNEDVLSDLIKDRIENSITVGPYVDTYRGDKPTDIISELIFSEDGFRKKITPAICLLLFKLVRGQIQKSNALMRGVFLLIQDNRIEECHRLVEDWLRDNFTIITNNPNEDDRLTYRGALDAFACVQQTSDIIELYWSNMWREATKFWWGTSFTGLRLQNPKTGCKELPLLIERDVDNVGALLYAMWSNKDARSPMECAIKKGLKEDEKWSGIALHKLLDKCNTDQRDKLLTNLKV